MHSDPGCNKIKKYLNLLEPQEAVSTFLSNPPENFSTEILEVDRKSVPGFLAKLDLFTTADEKLRKLLERHEKLIPGFIKNLFTPEVFFIGTTVSEYALFPDGIDLKSLKNSALKRLNELGLKFLIIKDIPSESPLLSCVENEFSKELISYLENSGFMVIFGQALAYVQVDFGSVEEYLGRFSRSRRKDFKRKLRAFPQVIVEKYSLGDSFFNEETIELFYKYYVDVYENSNIHFDKLTYQFFKRLLTGKEINGVVFLYRSQDKIIGYNICFLAKDYLIDKYIGFLYPEALEYNLYFLSWFYNLGYCIENNLKAYIVGWTDPEIKSYLGAKFTYTYHAVYIKNRILRFVLRNFKSFFESDRKVIEKLNNKL